MSAHTKPVDVDEATALNLVPMVDIMFLMLLFFMLGSDMGQRELEDVALPEASSVREDKDADRNRTTINVYHSSRSCAAVEAGGVCRDEGHWKVGIRGRDFDLKTEEDIARLRGLLKRDADESRVLPTDKVSERHVMIRGDRAARYGAIQRVIHVCSECGIYKVDVGAAEPAK